MVACQAQSGPSQEVVDRLSPHAAADPVAPGFLHDADGAYPLDIKDLSEGLPERGAAPRTTRIRPGPQGAGRILQVGDTEVVVCPTVPRITAGLPGHGEQACLLDDLDVLRVLRVVHLADDPQEFGLRQLARHVVLRLTMRRKLL